MTEILRCDNCDRAETESNPMEVYEGFDREGNLVERKCCLICYEQAMKMMGAFLRKKGAM